MSKEGSYFFKNDSNCEKKIISGLRQHRQDFFFECPEARPNLLFRSWTQIIYWRNSSNRLFFLVKMVTAPYQMVDSLHEGDWFYTL